MHGVWSNPGKARNYEPKIQKFWMKQYCLWGETKFSLFHAPNTAHYQFPNPFQSEIMETWEKKKTHTGGKKK